jgi:hypothetical protein
MGYSADAARGLVDRRLNRQTGTLVSIYLADEAGIDTDGVKYAVVCEEHGAILAVSNLKLARYDMASPMDWCEDCRGERA